ncbi:unnamed protein product [Parnassius mnemosyne]|uniref:Uncharacterized protein n=1 Tax=Parnassius mnemosyne TaxID=213953 RepID=A0AAV1LZ80_9NEOP
MSPGTACFAHHSEYIKAATKHIAPRKTKPPVCYQDSSNSRPRDQNSVSKISRRFHAEFIEDWPQRSGSPYFDPINQSVCILRLRWLSDYRNRDQNLRNSITSQTQV